MNFFAIPTCVPVCIFVVWIGSEICLFRIAQPVVVVVRIAGVTVAIAVEVQLIGIGYAGAIVDEVAHSVAV